MPFTYCRKCKKWLQSTSKFCVKCGFPQGKSIPKKYDDRTSIIYRLCPHCNIRIDSMSKFCVACGKKINFNLN